jgi:cytochrome c-type biogenesis protein
VELTIPVVLLAGVVSFASPCFLPVVPVFVGYLAGQPDAVAAPSAAGQPGSAGQSTSTATMRRRLAGATQGLAFILAFATVFIALWALVGVVGWAVGGYKPVLRIGGGIVVVALGLHLAGLLRLAPLDRALRINYTPQMSDPPSYRRSVLLGLAFGAAWTPCIGPVLGGVLGLATNSGSVGSGIALLSVYTLGLGLPFVLVCAGASVLLRRLAWFPRHQRAVNAVVGGALMIIGFLMISNLLERLSSSLFVAL